MTHCIFLSSFLSNELPTNNVSTYCVVQFPCCQDRVSCRFCDVFICHCAWIPKPECMKWVLNIPSAYFWIEKTDIASVFSFLQDFISLELETRTCFQCTQRWGIKKNWSKIGNYFSEKANLWCRKWTYHSFSLEKYQIARIHILPAG